MDLDELRSAQSRERQASQLQHLRDGFYEEAASFIQGLRTERERATANSEYSYPYDDPEVQRLTNEIQTAEEVVESLYERRVGKVVKMASFDAAGMAVDAEGLTAEEGDLFETLVGDIESNRARVLDALAGSAGGDGTPGPGGAGSQSGTPSTASAADADHEGTPTAEDEPVHIGSGPTADGPVSTADEQSRENEMPEQAPTPGVEREAAAPESAPETPPDEAVSSPETPPGADAGDDEMDAASAMGGTAGDDTGAAPSQSSEVPGGVPTEQPPGTEQSAPTDTTADTTAGTSVDTTADVADATGTETADGTDHQPVPPRDGPPGADSQTGSHTQSGTESSPSEAEGGAGADTSPDVMPGAAPSGESTPGTADAGGPSEPAASGDATPSSAADAGGDDSGTTGTLVRITADVGEIFGVDGRAYDLSADDVAVLPADNAELLVADGDAERLDSAVPFSGGQSTRS